MYKRQDVSFVGTGQEELALGKEHLKQYIREDILEMKEPFICSLRRIFSQSLSNKCCNISMEMKLKNSIYSWSLRVFFILTCENGLEWKIRSFHAAEPGGSQRDKEHYPHTLVIENIVRQRQELLLSLIHICSWQTS